MDPNAALEVIRDYVRTCDELELDSDLIGAVDGLDKWLCSGGFLPDDWREGGAY